MERGGAPALAKEEVLAALDQVRDLFQSYGTLLEHVWDESLGEEQRGILERHATLAAEEDSVFDRVAMMHGLLRFVVQRLRVRELTFRTAASGATHAAEQHPDLSEYARQLHQVSLPLERLTSHVFAVGRSAQWAQGARFQRLLYPIAGLFKTVVRQDWADAQLLLHHLNIVTTSRDSHELVEQIGRLVRNIYDSLNDISNDLPMERLSDATDELPDAVTKLNSVIVELEDSANRNLDLLEVLSEGIATDRKQTEAALAALGEVQAELRRLGETDAAAAQALAAVHEHLQSGVAEPLVHVHERLQESHDIYMTLFANQSYQDLTGQTLKKVIAFIESLQYQLIQVISRETGKEPVLTTPALDAEDQQGPDALNRLSQDRVDTMLAELGF